MKQMASIMLSAVVNRQCSLVLPCYVCLLPVFNDICGTNVERAKVDDILLTLREACRPTGQCLD